MLGRAAAVTFVAAAMAVAPASPAVAVSGAGGPCVIDASSLDCRHWIDEQSGGAGEEALVCTHAGAPVPCRSPWRDWPGWWVGEVVIGGGWSVIRIGEVEHVDRQPEGGWGHGCWALRLSLTGEGETEESPGSDPSRPGAWYRLLCLGEHAFVTGMDFIHLWGAGNQLHAWGPTSTGPPVDPVTLAQRAFAQLEITAPPVSTAPPPGMGSVPLGMPVWLAVDDTDGSAWWGPLTEAACEGSLCVEITARVDRVEWDLGDGHHETCTRSRNVVWHHGHQFLDPTSYGACHHYYDTPSRDLPDGAYPIGVTTVWHTHWRAPSLGLDSGDTPLVHTETVDITIAVQEIQVLVRR